MKASLLWLLREKKNTFDFKLLNKVYVNKSFWKKYNPYVAWKWILS